MENQLNLALNIEKKFPLYTINARGIFIFKNLKVKLPDLYNYIMTNKTVKQKNNII